MISDIRLLLKAILYWVPAKELGITEGITHKQSHYAQTLADHPEAIEEVIEKAKEKEEISTRYEVLKEFYLLTTMIK